MRRWDHEKTQVQNVYCSYSKRLSRQLATRFFEDDLLKPAGTSFDQLFDFNNDTIHATFSRIALRLREDDKKDASMLAAFKKADLDHQNPLHWRELLSILAESHFGPIRTKPQKWDSSALCEVLKDYSTISALDHLLIVLLSTLRAADFLGQCI